jgi:hypothetical protein
MNFSVQHASVNYFVLDRAVQWSTVPQCHSLVPTGQPKHESVQLCVCSRDGVLSEKRGDVCIDCSVIGRTPRRTNRPENGPSLCKVI